MGHLRSTGEPGLWGTGLRRRLTGLGIVVILVTAVLLLPRGSTQEPTEGPPPQAEAPSLAPPVVVAVTPAAFCSAFRELAGAHTQHLTTTTEESANRVLDQAASVVDLGVPAGLSNAGYAAFANLVDGILSPIEDSETLRARVLSVARTESPDQAELDRYLGDVCPP